MYKEQFIHTTRSCYSLYPVSLPNTTLQFIDIELALQCTGTTHMSESDAEFQTGTGTLAEYLLCQQVTVANIYDYSYNLSGHTDFMVQCL